MSTATPPFWFLKCLSANRSRNETKFLDFHECFISGQKNYERVKKTFWYGARIGFCSMCCFAVVGIIFASHLIGIFRDDPEVIRVGSTALRLICLALPFASFGSEGNILFQMVEMPGKSSLLIFGRQLGVYISVG